MATSSNGDSAVTSPFLWIKLFIILVLTTACYARNTGKIVAFFQGRCEDPNPCQHICQNIYDAGFICSCKEGFELESNGASCKEIPTKNKDVIITGGGTSAGVSMGDVYIHENPAHYKILSDNVNVGISKMPEKEQSHDSMSAIQPNESKDQSNKISNHPENEHRKTKNLKEDKSVQMESPEIKIKTVDLKLEKHDPMVDFSVIEGGDHSDDEMLSNAILDGNIPEGGTTDDSLPEGLEKMHYRVTCDGIICANNGTCVVDGYHARCNCPLGTAGDRCEKEITVQYPKFQGTGYLALPILRDGYKEFWISLEFRPEAKNGLVVFSAELPDAKTDFFSLALVDGFMEFRFDCGTGLAILRSQREVNLGQWNRVLVHRVDNRGSMKLNDESDVDGTAQGAYSRITLRLNLFMGGYSNMSAISGRTGTRKQFVGCIQELRVNSHKYDMRKSGLVGESEHGVNVGECSEGLCDNIVCLNEGVCSVKSADSHVCLCPLGTSGTFCEKVHEVHIPKFGGHSYLMFTGLGRSVLSYTEIETVFKPMSPEGTILYNGYTTNRQGDFISLAMRDGYLEFRFDLGTGPAILRSLKPLALDHWHVARVSRTGLQGVLEVDDQPRVEGVSRGAYTQLTLLEDLFLGGHKSFDDTSKYANLSSSFVGCIQKVVVNKKPLKLMKDLVDGVNIEPCAHPCAGEPCMNGGECMPYKDVYTCFCPLGYANTNCEDRMRKLPNTPMFIGTSFLMYTDRQVIKRVTGNKIDIQLHIKPKDRNGLLFWSGQDHMTSSSDFIALGFIDGSLQLRYNLGSGEAIIGYNDSRLFDGYWHFIRAQRDKQDAYLEIDGAEIVEGSSPGSYTMLNTNKILYLGGMPDVVQNTLGKFTSGFVGCMKDITLATDLTVKLIGQAQSGRNVYSCS